MREQQTWQRKLDEVRRTAVRSKNRISREGPLLDGYLYVARVRCGRANCKCRRRDYRHELWCLSFREQGRSRTVTVPAAWRPRVAKAAGDYREARRLLRELQTQVREAAAAAGARLAVRVEGGRQLLAELLTVKATGRPRVRSGR